MDRTRVSRDVLTGIPVVDLFAGAGGLGEGFAALEVNGSAPFDVQLSIEKEAAACSTLILRKYFRQFARPPEEFAAYFARELDQEALFDTFPAEAHQARDAVWQVELGKVQPQLVARRIRRVVGGRRDWVLVGGPPCQAYSMIGRARMRSTHVDFENDERHLLYREYLRILADHEPAVFVFENVKGLLTSTHGGSRILSRILDDLAGPGEVVGRSRRNTARYRLYPLGQQRDFLPWMGELRPDGEEFLLYAEQHGIPQARHRLFIVGIRSDVAGRPGVLERQPEVRAGAVLEDLPAIRSTLSREKDSFEDWCEAIAAISEQSWLSADPETPLGVVAREIKKVLAQSRKSRLDPGTSYSRGSPRPALLKQWYRRGALGLAQHESRAHMREDLHRYLFSACFAKAHGRSPKLKDFPEQLHPSHQNVGRAVEGRVFEDRFRVQLADRPAGTITSHVSKDGHYYIHPDPAQCRSLTVREAARLQTFPDSYFFEGTRTEQYAQVGNAVPPLLARDIAQIVYELLARAQLDTTRSAVAR